MDLIDHDTRPDAHAAFFEIEIGDLPVVARKVDNQSLADRVANQTCACASRRYGKTRISCGMNDCTRLLRGLRKRNADRLNLINRRVSRVELTRQIIKARLTTGLPDFPFLNGSHPWLTILIRVSC